MPRLIHFRVKCSKCGGELARDPDADMSCPLCQTPGSLVLGGISHDRVLLKHEGYLSGLHNYKRVPLTNLRRHP